MAALLVCIALAGVAWRAAAFVTAALAWFMLGAVALSLMVGVAVPGTVVVGTVGLWLASQAVTRLRHGYWRSGALRRFIP